MREMIVGKLAVRSRAWSRSSKRKSTRQTDLIGKGVGFAYPARHGSCSFVTVARRQVNKLPLTTKQLKISPRLKRIIGLYIAWLVTAG